MKTLSMLGPTPSLFDSQTLGYIRDFQNFYKGGLPCTAEELCLYLLRSFQGTPAEINRILTAFSRYHRILGLADPTQCPSVLKLCREFENVTCLQTPISSQTTPTFHCVSELTKMLKGEIQRHRQELKKARALLNHDRARLIHHKLLTSVRNRAILLVSYWYGLEMNETCALSLEDVVVTPKRIQIIDRPTPKSHKSPPQLLTIGYLPQLCPVRATHAWLGLCKISEGLLFPDIRAGELLADTPATNLQNYFRSRAKRITPDALKGPIVWRNGLLAFLLDCGWSAADITQCLPQYRRKHIRHLQKEFQKQGRNRQDLPIDRVLTTILSHYTRSAESYISSRT